MSLHRERGPMIEADLRALPTDCSIIAEGTPITPSVAPPTHALWLLPTPAVQRARLAARDLPEEVHRLYAALTEEIAAEVAAGGVKTLLVDGGRDAAATLALVEEAFADTLPGAPAARTRAERQALLRAGNRSVVDQCLAFFARPWAPGDPRHSVQSFACECGAPHCVAELELSVAAAARGTERTAAPLLAPGHRSR